MIVGIMGRAIMRDAEIREREVNGRVWCGSIQKRAVIQSAVASKDVGLYSYDSADKKSGSKRLATDEGGSIVRGATEIEFARYERRQVRRRRGCRPAVSAELCWLRCGVG